MKKSLHKVAASKTRTIPAGIFKAKCLALMDEVQRKSESLVITKRGKPIVKVVPVPAEDDDLFGFMRGKVAITGDIVSPAIPLEEWNLD
ncbi:MAG TPA: type II toxin-antitoxin system prevent-host-death family antitoxin [Terriglobales bacterium]|nr:type II toxin-antitoxin system prevent-host-death family antitoxin [Terriglobales bacterium]